METAITIKTECGPVSIEIGERLMCMWNPEDKYSYALELNREQMREFYEWFKEYMEAKV